MSRYRKVYRCKRCGKVYPADHKFQPTIKNPSFPDNIWYSDPLCEKCGSIDKIETIYAKPVLFGILGWKEAYKEENE